LREFVLDRKLKNAFWEWLVLLRAPAVFGAYLGHGVVSGRRAIKHLRDTLPLSQIEDSPNAALSIGVTNLTRRQGQLVTQGEVAPYVVASCAVSPIIRAQEIDGELFLDGGFTDAAPFEHWIDDPGIDTIIIHNITFDPPAPHHWSRRTNFICCWAAVHHMVECELTAFRIQRAKAAGKHVIVHQTHTARPRFFGPSGQFEDNYNAAYKAWHDSPKLLAGKPGSPLP
jgi:predicted acylesterase/phospholipase RssA